ncbi:MAG: tetratricopeptide repeat protein, partial [Myxococcota bacterium]
MSFVVAGVLTSACASTPPPLPEPTSLAPPTPKVPSPAERFATATSAFEAGDYAAAIANYDAILANDPRNAGVLYNRALALHRSGDYERAQTAYAATLKANPSDLDAAINLGAVKKEIGDTAGAIALYRQVLANDEFNPKVLNNLAALYRADGQHTKAIKTIRKLLMRDKNNVDAYKNLALVYFDQKKYRLTQTILDNALQMARTQNRAEPDIFVNMGRMFLATNKNGRAMAAFKRAVALAPN